MPVLIGALIAMALIIASGGRLLVGFCQLVAWAWAASPPLMTLLGVGLAAGLLAPAVMTSRPRMSDRPVLAPTGPPVPPAAPADPAIEEPDHA